MSSAAAMGLVPFEYAALRAVPRVDRGEFINVGVLLYCQAGDYLAAAVELQPERIQMLDPGADLEVIRGALAGVQAVCAGDPLAGLAAAAPVRARFGWLTAARSTIVQAGPVHIGMTADPAAELNRLLTRLVR